MTASSAPDGAAYVAIWEAAVIRGVEVVHERFLSITVGLGSGLLHCLDEDGVTSVGFGLDCVVRSVEAAAVPSEVLAHLLQAAETGQCFTLVREGSPSPGGSCTEHLEADEAGFRMTLVTDPSSRPATAPDTSAAS